MLITMKPRSNKLWLDNNLGSIDIDVLKSSNILTQDNTLDPMFLLALEFSTKFGAIDSNIGKVKPEFKEVLTYGTSILLERMGFTNDDNHLDYVAAVIALVERQADSSMMNKRFSSGESFSFYG